MVDYAAIKKRRSTPAKPVGIRLAKESGPARSRSRSVKKTVTKSASPKKSPKKTTTGEASDFKYIGFSYTDPSAVFLISILFSVVFVVGHKKEGDVDAHLSARPLAEIPETLFNFLLDPCFLAGGLFLAVALHLANSDHNDLYGKLSGNKPDPDTMTKYEIYAAGWYLWNGCICHVMLDGMAGGNWGNHLMNANYRLLDLRFNWEDRGTAGGPHASDVAAALTVTQTELWCHSTLCLFAYVGYCRDSAWKQEIGILALAFQLFGAIVFVGPEFLTGCINMVPHNEYNCMPDTGSLYNLFYFYFGVGANFVWVVIPVYMIWEAVHSSAAQKEGK